jgi:hypothetical protein
MFILLICEYMNVMYTLYKATTRVWTEGTQLRGFILSRLVLFAVIFWHVTSNIFDDSYQRFGWTRCFPLQGRRVRTDYFEDEGTGVFP